MRTLKIISVLFLLWNTSLYAQNFEQIKDSSNVKSFNEYVNNILRAESDSIIPKALSYKYQIKYMTTCPYYELVYKPTFVHDSVFYIDITDIKGFSLPADSIQEIDSSGTVRVGNRYNKNSKTFYLCCEEPMINTDTTVFTISLNNSSTSNNYNIIHPVFLNDFGKFNGFKARSFGRHKYIILERSGISSIGSETSQGSTQTYFLEMIK